MLQAGQSRPTAWLRRGAHPNKRFTTWANPTPPPSTHPFQRCPKAPAKNRMKVAAADLDQPLGAIVRLTKIIRGPILGELRVQWQTLMCMTLIPPAKTTCFSTRLVGAEKMG